MRPLVSPPRPAAPAAARALLGGAVIDVRPAAEFARGHLPGSGQFETAEFRARRSELPPRHACVLVVAGDAAAARAAAETLAALEFREVWWLDAPLADWPEALDSRAPAARLWRPNPFLAELLPQLPLGRRALDLAAGAGRDAVALALHGFDTEAWDHDAEALARATALARREGVALRTLIVDLEAPAPPLPAAAWDLIVCFRFLHRPLFPAIERALAPGGHLVYETYRAGQERFGRPRRPRFMLGAGELERAFPDLEVLRYEEPSPPGGPWTARLWARKSDSSGPASAP